MKHTFEAAKRTVMEHILTGDVLTVHPLEVSIKHRHIRSLFLDSVFLFFILAN